MITWAEVVKIAPDLSSVGVDSQNLILEHVDGVLSPSDLGGEGSTRYKMCQVYLSAHLGSVVLSEGKGQVVSASEGGISLSFHSYQGDTIYWHEYKKLIMTSPARAPVII